MQFGDRRRCREHPSGPQGVRTRKNVGGPRKTHPTAIGKPNRWKKQLKNVGVGPTDNPPLGGYPGLIWPTINENCGWCALWIAIAIVMVVIDVVVFVCNGVVIACVFAIDMPMVLGNVYHDVLKYIPTDLLQTFSQRLRRLGQFHHLRHVAHFWFNCRGWCCGWNRCRRELWCVLYVCRFASIFVVFVSMSWFVVGFVHWCVVHCRVLCRCRPHRRCCCLLSMRWMHSALCLVLLL